MFRFENACYTVYARGFGLKTLPRSYSFLVARQCKQGGCKILFKNVVYDVVGTDIGESV